MTRGKLFQSREGGAPALVGMWLCSGSPLVAEICGGSGIDWVLIDAEHSVNSVRSIAHQLQVLESCPALVVVRPPSLDEVVIKHYLDIGVENLLIPMVNDPAAAATAVAATRYPPTGIRGVGSAFSRAARWGRVDHYLATANSRHNVIVQIETVEAVEAVEEILDVDGVDAIFVGPSDLAASYGAIGQQGDSRVRSAVRKCIEAAAARGKPCGVNAFDLALAREYRAMGVEFLLIGADVTLLARGSEQLASSLGEKEHPGA